MAGIINLVWSFKDKLFPGRKRCTIKMTWANNKEPLEARATLSVIKYEAV